MPLSMEDASEASDDDTFISDDGSDWRAQLGDRESPIPGVDLHQARIAAGLDPSAGADDELEDDVDMDDVPAETCRFVDNEAGEASDDYDDE